MTNTTMIPWHTESDLRLFDVWRAEKFDERDPNGGLTAEELRAQWDDEDE
jgi:hypothetical protein